MNGICIFLKIGEEILLNNNIQNIKRMKNNQLLEDNIKISNRIIN